MTNKTFHLIAIGAALGLASCSGPEKAATETSTGSPLDTFAVAEPPTGASQISEVFRDPTPGREVVLSGEVMGRLEPFVEGRAIVTLGDPTRITPCNRIPGDGCPTPWDNCCDDPDVLRKSITTIQFLDENGALIKTGLRGYRGLEELSFVTVKGTIAEGSNPENLLVNATAFHVAEVSPYADAAPVGHHAEAENEKTDS